MTQQEARCQSLASCGAFLIAFIGSVHEAVGARLLPWAPGLFTVPGFHLIGVAVIGLGLMMLLGALRMIRFPVAAVSLTCSAACALMLIFIAVRYRQFHYFCLWVVIAGVSTAIFHTKAEKLRAGENR